MFTMEINNRRKGTRTAEMILSTTSWDAFEEWMGEVLNMYSTPRAFAFSTVSAQTPQNPSHLT